MKSQKQYQGSLKLEAACTSEMSATLTTSTWCKDPRAEFTSIKFKCHEWTNVYQQVVQM
jgi:hypothetical protein